MPVTCVCVGFFAREGETTQPSSTVPSVCKLFQPSRNVEQGCLSHMRAEIQVPFNCMGLVAEHI